MRVATLMMTRMLCSMTISVTPASRSRPIRATRSGMDRWSTPPVTSSSMRRRGRVAMARAISRRFRCPVESSRAKAPALPASPTSERQRSASARAAPVDAARASAPTVTFSRTVMPWNGRSFWNVRPMPRRLI